MTSLFHLIPSKQHIIHSAFILFAFKGGGDADGELEMELAAISDDLNLTIPTFQPVQLDLTYDLSAIMVF